MLSDLTVTKRNIILLGDFNIDLLKYNEHELTNNFLNTLSSYHFLPSILQPTRITETTATLIDNIFTNMWPRPIHSAVITSDISDHLPVSIWFSCKTEMSSMPSNYSTRIVNDHSINLFKALLMDTQVSCLCNENDPNAAYDTFFDKITKAYNKAFPVIQVGKKNHRTFKNPWMTKGLLKSCNKKHKLHRLFIKTVLKLIETNS